MTDPFGREITYLRLSVTERCNLRCRYCMPREGICKKRHDEMLTEDEMIRAVGVAASLGMYKLRITGGEPLIKKNILSICERAASTEGIREVCLTTNGTLLSGMAASLKDAGVSRLNISLDTLDPDKYTDITRGGALPDALQGIETALSIGFSRIKLNAVLIGGFNDDEIHALADLTVRYPVDMRFIELMPMTVGEFEKEAFIPSAAVIQALPELQPQEPDGGVAKLYRLPGAQGSIGLISPINAHFCSSCNRIRLTADGRLKPCLHSSLEFPIRGLSAEEMAARFREAVGAKPEWHGELSARHPSGAERNMNQIGG